LKKVRSAEGPAFFVSSLGSVTAWAANRAQQFSQPAALLVGQRRSRGDDAGDIVLNVRDRKIAFGCKKLRVVRLTVARKCADAGSVVCSGR